MSDICGKSVPIVGNRFHTLGSSCIIEHKLSGREEARFESIMVTDNRIDNENVGQNFTTSHIEMESNEKIPISDFFRRSSLGSGSFW